MESAGFFKTRDQVCELMDKILLQTIELIEQDVTLKINIEKLQNDGILNIAKTRYIQGQQSVSFAQLPTEESPEFNALKTVTRTNDEIDSLQFELQKHLISKDNNFPDPTRWFGVIIPQNLKSARDSFQKTIDLVIESANVEQRIKQNCTNYQKLKKIKETFVVEE